jgi:WD40 repeat protein/Flp pilus assembly protein TadD
VRDKTAQIVDLQSGRIVATFPHPAATRGVGWSADGQLLAVGCDDLRAYVWNVKARRLQSVLEGHQSAVIHVIFSADLLVTSSWDATSRLWDPVCGRHQLTAEGNALCFNKSGTRLAFLKGTHGGCWEVANGSDCRVLHNCQAGNRTPWPGYAGPRGVDFSPDGRLLASASGDGIRLFEQASGRELAHLSVGFSECALFEPNGASLIGCGESGLERWPIQGLIAGTRELRIGPGQMIPAGISGKFSRASWSADGRTLAVADHGHNQAVLVDLENPGKAIRLGNHSRITSAVVSPSGEWIATGSTRGDEVKVWPAARRGPARSVPTGPHTKSALVAFSPDGQWLVAGGMFEIRFWRVGTWEEGPVISRSENAREGAPMSFSPDGRLLAIARSLQMVQLIDMATIREIGTLTAPDPEPISWLRFSPDGSQLAVATDNNEIRLWNLRSIRFQLAALSLDWDLPPYPPESAGDHTAAPVQVTVETAAPSGQGKERERLEEKELRCKVEELSNALRERPGSAELYVGRSLYYHRLGEFDKDMADLQRALQLDPENYVACANLAWIYVKGPKEFRAPEKALPLAQRAVRLRPENRKLHNTLGVTLYRLGQWDGAIAAFEQAAQVNNGEATAFDLFFLAMSYKNLGKEALARKSLEQAVQWLESNESQLLPHQRVELSAYRAEAEAVLAAEPAQAEAP